MRAIYALGERPSGFWPRTYRRPPAADPSPKPQLAETGATVHQIATWTGHITLEEIEHYTKEANRRAAARGEQKRKPVNR